MVLILSNNFDPSTSDVINWLDYQDTKWFRINETDKVELISIEMDNNAIINIIILINNEHRIDLDKIDAYWYRRGYLATPDDWKRKKYIDDEVLQSSIYKALKDDDENTFDYIHNFIQDKKPNINSYLSAKNNKLNYLSKAIDSGLAVPKSIICTTKTELLNFYHQNAGKIITKSINEGFFTKISNYNYYSYTHLVSLSDIEASSSTFFPSLFQEYIEKFVELRIFYFQGTVSCMAIFSQLNEATKIDLRNYDNLLPNRQVPFSLPTSIVSKINIFMKSINLNSGSLDMIITPTNEYYFLEVNPVGQFGMVSYPCNYKLEKQLADFLTRKQ